MTAPVTVDFETFAIEGRPQYPPRPVGISIKYRGKKARYYAFGHPTENNCTEAEAKAAAKKAWRNAGGILCQNAKFDVDVAEVHWGIKCPKWDRVHDTMFLIFLDDPNQQTFSLKPSAARLLNMPPEEQEAVRDWLIEHQPVKGVRITKTNYGAFIAYAPGKLVGKYANGDTVRTEKVFDLLIAKTKKRGMMDAYNRERRLLPILLEMERRGVPVLHKELENDVKKYNEVFARVDAWISKRLRIEPGSINFNSGDQLFEAMRKAKLVDEKRALRTPTGKFQTNKEALLQCVKDPQLLGMLKYRAQLKTCLGTFMQPWLTTADIVRATKKPTAELTALFKEKKSLIFTQWNQVKGDGRGGTTAGARTGRLSSTPNFQNIPKVFAAIFKHEENDAKKRRNLPKCPLALPPLPNCRKYITAFAGHVLIDRDYSQQEPRILAHFDGGKLLAKYKENPWIDFHDFAQQELAKVGLFYERRPVKNTNLGLIYGMGIGTLAERNDMEVDEAKKLKGAIMRLYPGLREMYQEAKRRAAAGEPVRTWGGREYFCEPPRIVEGRFRQFDYKLVNVLIQGSAADCTKEAIIRCYEANKSTWYLLLNVHDQLTESVPRREAAAAMKVLRKQMESIEFDVEMLTEGSEGPDWANLKDTDKKGKEMRYAA